MNTTPANLVLVPPPLPSSALIRDKLATAISLAVEGRVAAVAGEIIELTGMTAPLGAICELTTHNGRVTRARVIGFRDVRPLLAPLEPVNGVAAGDRVRLLDRTLRIPVGDAVCGRVLDAFGDPIDGRPLETGLAAVDSVGSAPQSLQRPPIDEPLQTGVRAIDALLTCGRGQRLGIFAGSGIGKSTLLGMLARGTSAQRIVIGMVGERGREVQEFLARCLSPSARQRSVTVVATSDRPAAQRVAAAWTATSIAESFRDRGHDVLLLIDSVTRFAIAQRELGLAAGEPPTTRGYPPSVFNQLPRLVERSGRTERGSITAFYTVLVEGDDHNEPVADTVRGLLDGHIVLSRDLAAQAHWPPIDVLQSLSRLQPHLISREVAAAAVQARKHLSEYQRHADLISIGAYRPGTDSNVDAAIEFREPLNELLRQGADEVVGIDESQAALLALMEPR